VLFSKFSKYPKTFVFCATNNERVLERQFGAQRQHGGLYVLLPFLIFKRFLSDKLSQDLPTDLRQIFFKGW